MMQPENVVCHIDADAITELMRAGNELAVILDHGLRSPAVKAAVDRWDLALARVGTQAVQNAVE